MMAAPTTLYLKLRRNGMRLGLTRAFTLVEVMVAVVVFCMMALGIYKVMLKAYELNAVARCTDDGRAVLATFGDQFMRLQSSDYNAAWPDGHGGTIAATYTRWLFQPTSGGPTGTGLTWSPTGSAAFTSPVLSDTNGNTPLTSVASLPVTIGGPTLNVAAQVTRAVNYIDISTGAVSLSKVVSASGGYMVLGTFTISYSVYGDSRTQSLSVVRYVP